MTTNEAFLQALSLEGVRLKYSASSVRTWRSRAIREKLSLDFMIEFLIVNGYKVKQPMEWHVLKNANGTPKEQQESGKDRGEFITGRDTKAQLNKKLYAVRKQLSVELYTKWYEWSKAEYANDFPHKTVSLTPVVFSQMTYGRYISKENVPFAVKILKEGKNMLKEYNEYIKREVESL